ncbi:unnamed protein product, partial [Scytosiphon promiscuus]
RVLSLAARELHEVSYERREPLFEEAVTICLQRLRTFLPACFCFCRPKSAQKRLEMVAPPDNHQARTPLRTAAENNSSVGSVQAQRLNPSGGPRWGGDSENRRPAGWTENPAAAGAPLEAGRASVAGAGGGVLGVLPSATTTQRGPEVDDFSPRPAGAAPLSDRLEQQHQQHQEHQPLVEASGMTDVGDECTGGATRGGESKRASPLSSSGDVELEMWKLGLNIGSKLDAKDTVEKWCEAEVTAVDREAGKVFISYTYWSSKWDEWFDIDSPCLAPAGTKTYQPGGPLRLGHRVEALDENEQWLEAEVVEEGEGGHGLVHFRGYHEKFDVWMSPASASVRHFGPHRVAQKGANRSSARQASLAPGQQHVRQIAQLSSRYEHYARALRSHGLRVVPVEGDGNCLFRSVSHQIYGNDSHHRLVRARCMDYMESEAHFFEPYVEGDMAAFLRYLEVKRQNAVWGDDPEVQALCEIYDRPAEIWAYDPQHGAKTLRSFHEAAGSASGSLRTPMRLSYYGGGHYDSVAPIESTAAPGRLVPSVGDEAAAGAGGPGAADAATAAVTSGDLLGGAVAGAAGAASLTPEPGQLEQAALERSKRRSAEAGSGRWDLEEMKMRRDDDNSPAGRAAMDHALAWSRNVFEAQFNDLDSALVASVDHMEQSNLTSLEAASRDSELVVLQEEMLRSAQAQSEEEQMRDAIEASRNSAAAAAVEADLLRQAIAESMGSGSSLGASAGASAGAADTAVEGGAAGGAASPAVRGTSAASATDDSATAKAFTATAAISGGHEDEELKKALLMSGMAAGGSGAWETLPAEVGGPAKGFGAGDLEEDDADLRLAIEASLAGNAN